MSEDEYQQRIKDVETYYSERASWHHPERMYLPYALDCLFIVCEAIEALYYGVELPEPNNQWEARALAYWLERWERP